MTMVRLDMTYSVVMSVYEYLFSMECRVMTVLVFKRYVAACIRFGLVVVIQLVMTTTMTLMAMTMFMSICVPQNAVKPVSMLKQLSGRFISPF